MKLHIEKGTDLDHKNDLLGNARSYKVGAHSEASSRFDGVVVTICSLPDSPKKKKMLSSLFYEKSLYYLSHIALPLLIYEYATSPTMEKAI